jgi:hypothetical protein
MTIKSTKYCAECGKELEQNQIAIYHTETGGFYCSHECANKADMYFRENHLVDYDPTED